MGSAAIRQWLDTFRPTADGVFRLVVCRPEMFDTLPWASTSGYADESWLPQIDATYPTGPLDHGHSSSEIYDNRYSHMLQANEDQAAYIEAHRDELYLGILQVSRSVGTQFRSVRGPFSEDELLALLSGRPWQVLGGVPDRIAQAAPELPPEESTEPSSKSATEPVPATFWGRFRCWFVTGRWPRPT
jgi:hypothetical protein